MIRSNFLSKLIHLLCLPSVSKLQNFNLDLQDKKNTEKYFILNQIDKHNLSSHI